MSSSLLRRKKIGCLSHFRFLQMSEHVLLPGFVAGRNLRLCILAIEVFIFFLNIAQILDHSGNSNGLLTKILQYFQVSTDGRFVTSSIRSILKFEKK